ncbi:MAG: tRNA (N6-isopentenyl adenosine(37)-C2)-methylthiotransferase MiaB [Clostridia bacterium]
MTVAKYVPEAEIIQNDKIYSRLYDEINELALKYHIESYGCQMNDHDSEKLAGMLEKLGYTKAPSKNDADIIIFNTCCVREHAELRVFGNIGALKQQKDEKPGLMIGVCGCMMQQKDVAQKLYKRFPFVDFVFGTHELHRFPALFETAYSGERVFAVRDIEGEIAEGLPIIRAGTFSTSITIMYGCDNFCTYCVVPYVRGRERSRRPLDVLNEAQGLAMAGYKEITLLGQNVNSFKGDGLARDFPALLKLLNDESGIKRIRFMTSHPKDLSQSLVEALGTLERVCNHIHLPVQSGSSRVLAAMNRKYDREQYLSLVESLRQGVPGIEITTDVIVGFPGETDADYDDTLSLMCEAGFSAAYTFMYSKREGTKASLMPQQVPQDVKKQRLAGLNSLQAKLLHEGNHKYMGTTGEVLIEGCDQRNVPMAFGKLPNFKMVYFPGEDAMIGSIKAVKITDVQHNSLIGELI